MYRLHNAYLEQVRQKKVKPGARVELVMFVLKNRYRLICDRPITITEEDLTENLEELQMLQRQGKVYVTGPTGKVLDLFTHKETPPVPPIISSPNFPLDSINRDEKAGMEMSPVDLPPPKEFQMPMAPPDAALDDPIVAQPVAAPHVVAPPIAQPVAAPPIAPPVAPESPVVEKQAAATTPKQTYNYSGNKTTTSKKK